MEWYFLTAIVVGALLVSLASGLPIGFALGLLSFIGFMLSLGFTPALSQVGSAALSVPNNFVLASIPLFIFMGELLSESRVSDDLFESAHKWLGRLPGGLAIATVGSCGLFGAISGSSVAATCTIGLVAVPEMEKRRFSRKFAVGCVTAGGSLAPIIPPSIQLIIYGVVAMQSVSKLFIASIIPGIVLMIAQMVQIFIMTKLNPTLAPAGVSFSWKERLVSLGGIIGAVVLIFLVLGTIYLGVATPSEAAALGATGALLQGFIMRRLRLQDIPAALMRATVTSAMMFMLLIGARLFCFLLSMLDIPAELTRLIAGLAISGIAIIIGINFLIILMGMFLDQLSIMLVTVPVLLPIIMELGYNPIWFGAVLMANFAIADITPPFAFNIFAMASIRPDIPISEIIRGTIPFSIADLAALAIIIAFPVLSLWLPSMMLGA